MKCGGALLVINLLRPTIAMRFHRTRRSWLDNTINTNGRSPRLVDAKASQSAGYTKIQKTGYPLLSKNGGVIEWSGEGHRDRTDDGCTH